MTTEAKRNNAGKPDFTHLPGGYMREAAMAMMSGAEKYGKNNWRNALKSPEAAEAWIQTCKECLMRHTVAYALDGELNDPESGVTHLGHAVANLAMIVACEEYLEEGPSFEGGAADELPYVAADAGGLQHGFTTKPTFDESSGRWRAVDGERHLLGCYWGDDDPSKTLDAKSADLTSMSLKEARELAKGLHNMKLLYVAADADGMLHGFTTKPTFDESSGIWKMVYGKPHLLGCYNGSLEASATRRAVPVNNQSKVAKTEATRISAFWDSGISLTLDEAREFAKKLNKRLDLKIKYIAVQGDSKKLYGFTFVPFWRKDESGWGTLTGQKVFLGTYVGILSPSQTLRTVPEEAS